jgi:hypothetical protein
MKVSAYGNSVAVSRDSSFTWQILMSLIEENKFMRTLYLNSE